MYSLFKALFSFSHGACAPTLLASHFPRVYMWTIFACFEGAQPRLTCSKTTSQETHKPATLFFNLGRANCKLKPFFFLNKKQKTKNKKTWIIL
jgi:hypothetical protein